MSDSPSDKSADDLDLDTLDHLRLALVPGLGPKLTAATLARFGTAAAVLRASAGELRQVPLIGDKKAEQIAAGLRGVEAVLARELALLRRHGVRVAVRGTPGYPARLTTLDDAPGLLYTLGTPADDAEAVGVVGSRSCTSYGKRMAAAIAAGLAQAGFTVVSGLALGIDGAAHEGALEAGGRTVAVLGGGLAKIYPPQHAGLAARIAAAGGQIVTETPMVVETRAEMFPARNRIISALSRAVVVIEANDKSGALITARLAGEQGREVFVVPGNADSGHSAGCHELIRKGARLVRSAADILEDLRGIAPPDPPPPRREKRTAPPLPFVPPPAPAGPPPGLDETQLRLWEAVSSPRHADELARELGLDAAAVSKHLTLLEMKRAVRRLPGGMVERR